MQNLSALHVSATGGHHAAANLTYKGSSLHSRMLLLNISYYNTTEGLAIAVNVKTKLLIPLRMLS
jgi:hypothetical protein